MKSKNPAAEPSPQPLRRTIQATRSTTSGPTTTVTIPACRPWRRPDLLRHLDPLVDLGQLMSRRFGLPLATFLFSIFALFATGFLLPFYFEEMRGWSPLASGLLLTPFSLGVALAAPISGRLADRGDGRWLSPVGLGLAAIGLLLLAQVGVNSAPFEIALWLGISGIGQGIFVSPNTREVMSALPAERSGEASEMVALARVVGQAMSVAIVGAVFVGLGGAAAGASLVAQQASQSTGATGPDGVFLGAMHAGLLVGAALAAIGAVVSFLGRPPAGHRADDVDARKARHLGSQARA